MTAPTPMPADALLAEADWVRSLAARLAFEGTQGSDLEQEIWHAVLARPPRADVPLRPWLHGIATRLAAMARRSAARRRRREHAVSRERVEPAATDLAQQLELQQRLLAAVHALPEAMRDVVLLRHYEDLPPRAIAARLGVPVATVRTRLQRAAERLRGSLDAEFGDRRGWALAAVALARPRDVAVGSGLAATLLHTMVILVQTNKLVVAAATLAVSAAVPALYLLRPPGPPAPPDYSRAAPVASLFDRPAATPAARSAAADRSLVDTPAPQAVVLGKVVDRDGAPIADAVVRRATTWFDGQQMQVVLAARDVGARTGADGSFTLPAWSEGAGGLEAEHDQYVSLRQATECRAGVPTTIVMLRTFEVPLIVEAVDRTSRMPVPRFAVTGLAQWRSDGANEGRPNRELSVPKLERGTDGEYRGTLRFVEGLPVELRVGCSGHGLGEWGDGSDDRTGWLTIEPVAGEPVHVTVEFDLGAAERVAARVQRGRVVRDGDGAPIAGVGLAMVEGERAIRFEQSRADGAFAIALPKSGADGALRVEHEDYEPVELVPQPDRELEVRLVRRATFRCRVVDRDGQPLRQAPVLFRVLGRGVHERLATDDDGVFTVARLAADRYHVFLLANPWDADDHALAHAIYAVAAGAEVDVVLEAEPPDTVRVMGTLVGAERDSVPAFVPLEGAGRWILARRGERGYDAGGLRRGDYMVAIVPGDDGRDGPTWVLPRVHVDGFGTAVVDLAVPTGAVRGRIVARATMAEPRVLAVPVVPADGPAAELVASPKFAAALARPVAADGTFELTGVADAEYRLELRDGERTVASRDLCVRGGADLGDWIVDG